MPRTPRLCSFASAMVLATSSLVAAQQRAPSRAPVPTPAPTAGTTPAPAPPAAGPQLEPQGYTYDPQGRRHPFVSLLRPGSDIRSKAGGIRPPGLAGPQTGEGPPKGTITSQGAYV